MGCVSSAPKALDDDQAASNELEKELLKGKIDELFTFKILLLGAGESGKSTVVKQLRMIHNKRPSKNELVTIADSLHQNVVECMRALLVACEKFEIPLEDPKDIKTSKTIHLFDDGERISPELGDDIARLYLSKPVQAAYKRRSEFWLLDSCSYYMKNLDRFTEYGFEPNEEDSVMARIRTTGIVVSTLEQKVAEKKEGEPGKLTFKVVDVGGQRNERKKWIHCFDDVKAILFIVNLAGYNQVLFEDLSKNRMHESLELFNDITHRKIFQDTNIFLFLNKKDLFETMINETPLSNTFPDFKGGSNLMASLDFIKEQFQKQLPPKKEVAIQVVTGVWKRDIRCAFEEVKKELYDKNRKIIDAAMAKILKEQQKINKKGAGKGGGGMLSCGGA